MFNGSFLSSSFRVFFPLLSREALLVATTLTRDGSGGCSGGHVIYLSPYYPPPPCARVSAAFSTSLRLLPPTAASPRGAILGTPTISFSSSLFPLLSRSGSVVVSIARGNRDSLPPFLYRCFSLFLLFFVSFLSASILLARSIRPHLSFVRFALYISFLLSLLLHLNRLEYFGNYSRLVPLVLFFRAETYLYYSPFFFRLYLHSIPSTNVNPIVKS